MNYTTQDIYLAGYLVARDQQLSGSYSEAGSTVFQFSESDQLNQLVEAYYDLKAQVSPQRYGYALKVLKNLLYRNKHENKNYDNQRNFHQQRKGS